MLVAVAVFGAAISAQERVGGRDGGAGRTENRNRRPEGRPLPVAGDGATPLHWAAYRDELDEVTRLLAAGAKPDVANDLAITPLHLASVNGNAAIARALVEKGAKVNAESATGVTPLMEAARSGSLAVVELLLARGADVNAAEHDRGQTALMWAVARRHSDVVRALVVHKADLQARTRVRSLRVMLDQGPRRTVKTSMQDAHPINAGGLTALLFAAQSGDAMSARILLDAGANVNDTSADGRSALVLAAFAGHGDVARLLIDAGANTESSDAGYTALHAATLRGDLATVQALLANGANANARLSKGSPVRRFGSQWALPTPFTGATPLFVAAAYLEVGIMRALLAGGAHHSVGVETGTTPLHAVAGIPVEKEARPSDLARWHIVDSDTPQVPRDEKEIIEATRLLLDADADVNQTNDAGETALHAAAMSGTIGLIRLLVDRGATLEATNKAGQTPLALTLPRPRSPEGRPGAPGNKAAEELLRKLGASK